MEVNLYTFNFNIKVIMKKYLLHILIGLVLIAISDFFIGLTLRHFYFKQKTGVLSRTTYSIEKTNADILIFGSSRANHHYNTKIIETTTNLSAYNTGRDGHFIFYQTALLKAILKRHTPKFIILDFAGTFEFKQQDYDRLSSLLPYYKSHEEIRDIVELKSTFEKYKLISSIYPFNSTASSILVSNIRTADDHIYHGYSPLYGEITVNPKIQKNNSEKYVVDQNKYQVFEEFLKLTHEKKIPLIIVNSPIFYKNEEDFSIQLCKELCRKYKIPFKDLSNDSQFLLNKSLFDDPTHLNHKGATLFTEKILKFIAI